MAFDESLAQLGGNFLLYFELSEYYDSGGGPAGPPTLWVPVASCETNDLGFLKNEIPIVAKGLEDWEVAMGGRKSFRTEISGILFADAFTSNKPDDQILWEMFDQKITPKIRYGYKGDSLEAPAIPNNKFGYFEMKITILSLNIISTDQDVVRFKMTIRNASKAMYHPKAEV